MNTEIKERIVQIQNGEIPQGYKMSKEGTIPSKWKIKKMGKVFTRVTRKNVENNQNNLTISALEGLVSQEEYFNKQIASKDNTGYYLLKNGEFAYNKSYSNGYPMGAIKRLDRYEKGVVSTLYICFDIKDKTDSDFFTHYFENGNLNREIYKIAQEGARNHGLLNMSVSEFFSDIHLVLPSKNERDKITTILSTQDKIIELKEKLLTEKKRQKKYLMQVLLNPDSPDFKRLTGFNGEWKIRKLKDFFDITSSKRVYKSEWQSTGIPFYRARELVLLSASEEIKNPLYISEELYNTHKSKYGVPKNDDILITGVGTLGVTYLVSKSDKFYFKDGNIIWLKSLNKVNSFFIKYLYETPYIINQIFNSSSKTTVHTYTISNANMTKFPCPPSKSEQIKIVNILSKANEEIDLLEQQIIEEKLKKKALMQLLLTGKVSVKV